MLESTKLKKSELCCVVIECELDIRFGPNVYWRPRSTNGKEKVIQA